MRLIQRAAAREQGGRGAHRVPGGDEHLVGDGAQSEGLLVLDGDEEHHDEDPPDRACGLRIGHGAELCRRSAAAPRRRAAAATATTRPRGGAAGPCIVRSSCVGSRQSSSNTLWSRRLTRPTSSSAIGRGHSRARSQPSAMINVEDKLFKQSFRFRFAGCFKC